MQDRTRKPAPEPIRPQSDERLTITLASGDGALIANITANSPEEAPEAAARILVRRHRLDPGDFAPMAGPQRPLLAATRGSLRRPVPLTCWFCSGNVAGVKGVPKVNKINAVRRRDGAKSPILNPRK